MMRELQILQRRNDAGMFEPCARSRESGKFVTWAHIYFQIVNKNTLFGQGDKLGRIACRYVGNHILIAMVHFNTSYNFNTAMWVVIEMSKCPVSFFRLWN